MAADVVVVNMEAYAYVVATKKRTKKAYHHGDLRQTLLDAALALLAEEGLAGLSLRECARRAGVSHAAPYRHFKDKNGLLVAIAEEGFAALSDAGEAAMVGVDDPVERMDAYGVAYVRFAFEHPEHHRVMFTAEMDAAPESTRDVGARAFELLKTSATAAVGASVPPDLAAFAHWSLPHGLSMLILDGRVPAEHIGTVEQVEELARKTFAVWRRGGVPSKTRAPRKR